MINRITPQEILRSVVLILALLVPFKLHAQQYGARSFALAPDGLNVVSILWERQDLSLAPSGAILFKDADVRIDALSLAYNHYFDLLGRTAQVNFAVPYVFIDAATGTTFSRPPLQGLRLEADSD